MQVHALLNPLTQDQELHNDDRDASTVVLNANEAAAATSLMLIGHAFDMDVSEQEQISTKEHVAFVPQSPPVFIWTPAQLIATPRVPCSPDSITTPRASCNSVINLLGSPSSPDRSDTMFSWHSHATPHPFILPSPPSAESTPATTDDGGIKITDNHAPTHCIVAGCLRPPQDQAQRCVIHKGLKLCQVANCFRPIQSRGCCKSHGGGARCKFTGCVKGAISKGRCRTHGGGTRCAVATCTKWAQRYGCCVRHSKTLLVRR